MDPEWGDTTVLGGEPAVDVARLKEELAGDIIVPASYVLGRKLIAHDLVDELRIVVLPVVLGEGERLFDGTFGNTQMHLVDATTIGSGLVHLRYAFLHDR